MLNLVFVLPVYNERQNLPALLERIDKFAKSSKDQFSYRIIAVDDGSRDGSSEFLRSVQTRYKITLRTHRYNRGLGETLRDGLEEAADSCSPDDIIVTMDSDDTHDPAAVASMVPHFQGSKDVVICSRFQSGAAISGLSGWRSALSVGARVVLRTVLGISGVRDYSCGFRGIRSSTLQRAISSFQGRFIETSAFGFVCTVEVLWRLHLAGAQFAEVPFHLHYDRKKGASKMRVLRTLRGYLLLTQIALANRISPTQATVAESDNRPKAA